MKILFITNMCTHYVRPLYEALAKRYDVDFYFTGGHETYWHKPNELKEGNFKGTYLPGLLVLPNVKITLRILCLPWHDYDVVIKSIDDRFALPVTFMAAKIFKKPFILWTGLWAHPQTWVHQLTFPLTKRLYQQAEAIVAYGGHIRQYLVDLGIRKEKIFCASHATDNDIYNRPVNEEQRERLKIQLNVTGQKVILYVGRLVEGKGINYLIEAAASLRHISHVLVFVGTGVQQLLLEQMCAKKGVPCRFVGHIPNEQLYMYYAIADIFVLPSVTTRDFKEPWGLVINEAMNQGCPVVTTDAVGAAAGGLVRHGKTGFVVPERDPAVLKEVLEVLLMDKNLCGEIGANARREIQSWTVEGMLKGFIEAVDFVSPQTGKGGVN